MACLTTIKKGRIGKGEEREVLYIGPNERGSGVLIARKENNEELVQC